MSTVVLTGASSGIGAAVAVGLAKRGNIVITLGRSQEKLSEVHREMTRVSPSGVMEPTPITCDFTSLGAVAAACDQILNQTAALDVLINNAGVQPVKRAESADGFEMCFAINHLAPFLMTKLLAERILQSRGRVITTASENHKTGSLDVADLALRSNWTAMRAYDRSKLANVLFTRELVKRTSIAAACFCPGSIRTHLNRDSRWFPVLRRIEPMYYESPEVGAEPMIWLATRSLVGEDLSVYYSRFHPEAPEGEATSASRDAELWAESEKCLASAPTLNAYARERKC